MEKGFKYPIDSNKIWHLVSKEIQVPESTQIEVPIRL